MRLPSSGVRVRVRARVRVRVKVRVRVSTTLRLPGSGVVSARKAGAAAAILART